MLRVGVGLAIALAGCVSSNATVCPDGTVCAANTRCDERTAGGFRCLSDAQLAECDGKLEAQDCKVGDAPGACRDGACELFFCGDGYVTAGEECDGELLGLNRAGEANTCLDAGYYAREGLACLPTCALDTTACGGGFCGDDTVNGPELCDGPTNRACTSIGFDAGSVSCTVQCGFQFRDCTRFGWTPESLTGLVALAIGGSSTDDQWAVGSQGRAMRYQGAFWNPVPTGVTNTLIAVSALTPTDAWMVGQGTTTPLVPSVLLRWDGTQWKTVSAPAADYVDIHAVSATAVFAASSDMGIQAWNGSTWSELGTIPGTPIAIRGTATDDLWVATNEGPLYHWNGTTWQSHATRLSNAKLRFLDANARNDVWGVGSDEVSPSNAVIAHWNGSEWRTWRDNGIIYNNIASSGPKDTWVAGVDSTMSHFDGVSWAPTVPIGASSSGLAAVSGMQSYGANEVVAVSTLNLAYRYRGMAFGRLGQLPVFTESSAMWVNHAEDAYVGNVDGQVHHFDGTRWTVAFTVPGSQPGAAIAVRSLWGYGADVWLGTQDAKVFRDTGSGFTDMMVPATTPITHLWGTGPNDTWAFSSGGAFHWNGTQWRRDMLINNVRVLSVSGTATDDVWAVLDTTPRRTLMHYTNGGWTEVDVGARQISAVVAVTRTLVYVSANDGHILKLDGTSVIADEVVPAAAELEYMAASGPTDVIAASERELFHHDGHQWSPMRPPIDFVPNTPDYVPMRGIQVSPGRVDMLLQRLKVRTLLRTRPIACELKEDGLCTNRIDDDCDGKIDEQDKPDCP